MKNISYGLYSVLAAIQQRPFHIQELCLQDGRQDKRIQEIKQQAKANNIRYKTVSKDELEVICNTGNHQGVVAIFNQQQMTSEADLLEYCVASREPLLLLILDQIVDPHNLGACLRTAEAAGVTAVISSKRNSAPLTATVRKVACGAAERMPLIYAKNLARFIDELKQLGVWIYGTKPNSEKLIYQADLKRSSAIVIGSEGSGIRRLILEKCDVHFGLPMAGNMASLNASVATGLCLYEAVRQRQHA